MIKHLVLSSLIAVSASATFAQSWVSSDLYKRTQSTYVSDIDAINIAMGAMDKACWKNLPYGAPYIKGNRPLTINKCGVLSSGFVDRLHGKDAPTLQAFISYGADYSPKGSISPIAPFENAIKQNGANQATKKTFLNLTTAISKQFTSSQKTLRINQINARFSPPQVVELLIFTNNENKLHSIYVVSLDAIAKKQKFYRVASNGVQHELTEKDFIRKTSLIVNPLYNR